MTGAALSPGIRAVLAGSGLCGPQPGVALATAPDPTGTFVVRCGDRVVKVHAADADGDELRVRLAVAATLPEVFLRQSGGAAALVAGRLVTAWPYGAPVDPDAPDDAPWGAAAELLSTLHAAGPPRTTSLPRQQMPASVSDALVRLARVPDDELAAVAVPRWGRAAVLAAAQGLPSWAVDRRAAVPRGRPTALAHGDWHLGQMVRVLPAGPWRLIDVDSLGLGDPAWDLARPAMWLLAGILDPSDWQEFLGTYREAAGPGLPPGDPWHVLEPFARAAAVHAAASAMARAARDREALDDSSQAFLEACRRMNR